MTYGRGRIAILPADESVSPRQLTGSRYYDSGWVAYVLFKLNDTRTRPTRLVTSHGSMGWKIGDELEFEHDQTGAYMGRYRVVGIVWADPTAGMSVGEIPDVKIKHQVLK